MNQGEIDMAIQIINSYARVPQQNPQSPNDDPNQKNPTLPEGPNDFPHPQPDPGKQPIGLK